MSRFMIGRGFGSLSLAAAILVTPVAAAAVELHLAPIKGEEPGVSIVYSGTTDSPWDYLELTTAEGEPLLSRSLGEEGESAMGTWRLAVEPGNYTVRWRSSADPSRAWQAETLAELAFAIDEKGEIASLPPEEPGDEVAVAAPEAPAEPAEQPLEPEEPAAVPGVDVTPAALQDPEIVENAQPGWLTYVNRRFGTSVAFPQDSFLPKARSETGDGRRFETADGAAVLEVCAWENGGAETMKQLRTRLLGAPGYEGVTYKPVGRSWFVLSGFRGDNVFYEKYTTPDGGNTVHAFAMEYPSAAKRTYDRVLERVENSFKPL